MQSQHREELPVTLPMNEAVHVVRSIIDSNTYALNLLAAAFVTTGNTTVANSIHFATRDLQDAARLLNNSYSDDLDRQLGVQSEASRNMINAALAGLAIGSESEPIQI